MAEQKSACGCGCALKEKAPKAPAKEKLSGRRMTPNWAGTLVQGVQMEDCVLSGGRFERAVFKDARFSGCTFEDCDFAEASFFDCVFERCRMASSQASGAALVSCRLSETEFDACDLSGLSLFETEAATCRLAACTLSEALLSRSRLSGVDLALSTLDGAAFTDVLATGWTIASTSGTGCRAAGLLTDCAGLMEIEERSMDAAAVAAAAPDSAGVPAGASTPGAAELAGRIVSRWLDIRDARLAERPFVANNERRTRWCLDLLGPDKSDFLLVVALLLHSEILEKARDLPRLPIACRLAGYQPTLAAMEAARRHFPDAALPGDAPDPVLIQALYTIGSAGTVAQTPSSDLDFWVCYDPGEMPPGLEEGLAFKLESIESWAAERFGLEVHFFPMDVRRIQENNFGVSDAESSGTAQAMLLKEEFYRTAVKFGGKSPLWWAVPPGCAAREYERVRQGVAASPLAPLFLDLGNLEQIPAGEFFGASLWQIVKALKSPFKSIMKFGLLEKYMVDSTRDAPLLCDRLKENLQGGRRDLAEVDPYVLLFREVAIHYRAAGDTDSLRLVRLSFLMKTKLGRFRSGIGLPALRSEDREAALLLGSKAEAQLPEEWPFERLVTVAGLVNRFVIGTYLRLRDTPAGAGSVSITPQDLTKLGRKIFSSFSKRPEKVEHIPFVSIGGQRWVAGLPFLSTACASGCSVR